MTHFLPFEATEHRLAAGRLATLSWGKQEAPVWLALHGWLDNAASFTRLAPLLVERLGIRVVALDFAGHGHSMALPGEYDYALWDYCHDVLDAMDDLGLEQTTLLAHSMGAGVASLLAAALPEKIAALCLIDGLGALATSDAEDAPGQLRRSLLALRRPRRRLLCYTDQASAVAARVSGGTTPVDAETIAPVVQRNLRPAHDGSVTLGSDPRLLRPSPVRLTPEQMLAMLKAIRCPTLLIEGKEGILAERPRAAQARAAIAGLVQRVLPGGHHLHLEPAHVTAVAAALAECAGRSS